MSTTCSPPIPCGMQITPDVAFKKLIQVDENGCAALNTVEVASADPAVSFFACNSEQDWMMLFFQMITEDVNGDWALRIIKSSV